MKILVVCQYYAPEPFRIADICESLVARGHSVTVVTGTPNYPEGVIYPGYEKGAHRDETVNGVKIHRCPIIPRKEGTLYRFLNYYSFPSSAKLYLMTQKEDYDVVFVNQLSPVMMAEPAMAWAKKHKKKCVLYCLDLWPESLTVGGIESMSPIYRFFLGVSKHIYRQANAIAVSSWGFAEYFRNLLGIRETPISYLPQYAEELFDDLPQPDPRKKTVDFLFAGNIGTTQSVETIIEAASMLQDDPRIRIHIVGGGSSLEHCQELAKDLPNVIFYGRRPLEEMKKFYAMADGMLITLVGNLTMSATLPGKAQSYMAAGKPMVGCANGETARVIWEAECGECAPAGDGRELSKIMLRMANNPKARKRYGENARKYYMQHFRKEGFMDDLCSLLEKNCR